MVASAEDLRQVSPLESFPLDRATVLHWIVKRDSGWVIEDHGEVVAYGELVPDKSREDRFWIGHMIVHPRRRGISAFADNARALRCYESCGFVRVDQERVEGRPLVGMRLKFSNRRHSPGPGLLATTGILASIFALVGLGRATSLTAMAVLLAMAGGGVLAWRLGEERRHSWARRMRAGLRITAIGLASGLLASALVGGFAGGMVGLMVMCGSATLAWIALLAVALRLQK
jgi:hypothetical protein